MASCPDFTGPVHDGQASPSGAAVGSGPAGRPESSAPPRGPRQLAELDEVGALEAREDKLGDPLAPRDPDPGRSLVHQDDPEFAAIVGVDRSGGVREGDTVAEGEPGAGPDLAFEVGGSSRASPVRAARISPGPSQKSSSDERTS